MLHENKRSSTRPQRQKNNNAGKALSTPPRSGPVPVSPAMPSHSGLLSRCCGGFGAAPVQPLRRDGQRCSPSITRTAAGPGLHGATAAEPSPSLQPQHRAGGHGASSGAEQRSRPLRHLQQPSKRSEQQEQSHARARPALCIICFNFGLIWGLFGVVFFFQATDFFFHCCFSKSDSGNSDQIPAPSSPAPAPRRESPRA